MSELIVPAVTAFVAVVTAFVAVLTLYHTLNDRRLRWQYDLFDRRWEIYTGVRDVLHGMSTSRTGSIAGLKAAEIVASGPPSPKRDESVLVLTPGARTPGSPALDDEGALPLRAGRQ